MYCTTWTSIQKTLFFFWKIILKMLTTKCKNGKKIHFIIFLCVLYNILTTFNLCKWQNSFQKLKFYSKITHSAEANCKFFTWIYFIYFSVAVWLQNMIRRSRNFQSHIGILLTSPYCVIQTVGISLYALDSTTPVATIVIVI